jgi:uncharacterized protein (UPF0332 family)
MPFDWNDYIKLAQHLYDNNSDQASIRSAISRAYYGSFGIVRPYCITKFGIPARKNGPEIHRTVIEKLKASSNKLEFSIGNLLSGLRDDRNLADYDSQVSFSKPEVKKCINNSTYVLENIETLKKSP